VADVQATPERKLLSDVLVFGVGATAHEFPSQWRASVCHMLPTLVRPTPQQFDCEVHVTETRSSIWFAFAEGVMVQLPFAACAGEATGALLASLDRDGNLKGDVAAAPANVRIALKQHKASASEFRELLRRWYLMAKLRQRRSGL
jgi:hypothetical protein